MFFLEILWSHTFRSLKYVAINLHFWLNWLLASTYHIVEFVYTFVICSGGSANTRKQAHSHIQFIWMRTQFRALMYCVWLMTYVLRLATVYTLSRIKKRAFLWSFAIVCTAIVSTLTYTCNYFVCMYVHIIVTYCIYVRYTK